MTPENQDQRNLRLFQSDVKNLFEKKLSPVVYQIEVIQFCGKWRISSDQANPVLNSFGYELVEEDYKLSLEKKPSSVRVDPKPPKYIHGIPEGQTGSSLNSDFYPVGYDPDAA